MQHPPITNLQKLYNSQYDYKAFANQHKKNLCKNTKKLVTTPCNH